MQTFLPYPDFKKSAECLDYRRLGKQRVEAKQIIELLERELLGEDISKVPWGNHPVVKMWKCYYWTLKVYYNIIVKEWIKRGYKNNMPLYEFPFDKNTILDFPPWFGTKTFHDSHKSNLLRKDPEYYTQFDWDVKDNLPYLWE